ncbi:hypothetical protein CFAM422_010512 [Trichoderma lentiforme]|uniref:Uncharacterized protein n=1 Tax=Trichoderma lentiforme TaxID=1567552 RepID=A0A9P5C9N4_9HYPO|nr:hypothetical protein CFAM422_010512 [Trichoderma lentiforme]
MGTVQEAPTTLARDSNADQVRTIAAMIGDGAEQLFPTTSIAPFLLSARNTFTIPGSCPFPAYSINITTFSPFDLMVISMIEQKDHTHTCETDLNVVESATISQQYRWMRAYLMDGLSLAAPTTKDDFSSVGGMLQFTLAAPAVLQADTYVGANHSLATLE